VTWTPLPLTRSRNEKRPPNHPRPPKTYSSVQNSGVLYKAYTLGWSWVEGGETMNKFTACRAYLAKLPSAVSGAGGHRATYRAACECIRFELSDADALIVLREWNGTHCRPPWTEKELAHKLSDARSSVGGHIRSFRHPATAVRAVWKVERKAAVQEEAERSVRNPTGN